MLDYRSWRLRMPISMGALFYKAFTEPRDVGADVSKLRDECNLI